MFTFRKEARASPRVHRFLVYIALGAPALGVLPTTVRAHGEISHAENTVSLAVIIALPVIAGVTGGLAMLTCQRTVRSTKLRRNLQIGFALLLVGLGIAFLVTALQKEVWLSWGGVVTGAVAAQWVAHRNASAEGKRHAHADLAFGGVFLHRLLEGAVIGALYSTGASAGVLGATAVAGHTVLETTAVGSLYPSARLRAFGAVILIQGAYVLGTIFGLGVGEVLPLSIQVLSLGFAGGILLVIGSGETRRLSHLRRPLVSEETVPRRVE